MDEIKTVTVAFTESQIELLYSIVSDGQDRLIAAFDDLKALMTPGERAQAQVKIDDFTDFVEYIATARWSFDEEPF